MKELNKKVNTIPVQYREAVIDIIEHKTDNDMREVIHKMENLEKNIQTQINTQDELIWGFLIVIVLAIASAIINIVVANKV